MAKDLEGLIRYLQIKGISPAEEVCKELGISRPTLSRLMKQAPPEVMRIGKTHSSQYGLKRKVLGLESELPFFRIDAQGTLVGQGRFLIFHQNHYAIEPKGHFFSGLPPEIADMRPQGFLGRAFSQAYSASLGVPPRILDWSNDHILIAEARRGEDLPGNLVIGQESAERWSQMEVQPVSRRDYPLLAQKALEGQPVGSSAGGEQLKFTAFVEGSHRIVKFASAENSPYHQRWRDLLRSEAIALNTLKQSGIDVSESLIHEEKGMIFLEVNRFDRINTKGRRATLTLAAIDDYLFGNRDTWAGAAGRLEQQRRISSKDANRLRFLDAFGEMIGDSDRHYHNIAFFPNDPSYENSLEISQFRLAPAFDKLPMYFAPVSGTVIERSFVKPFPTAYTLEVWEEALQLARIFWEQVTTNKEITAEFRKIGEKCRKALG